MVDVQTYAERLSSVKPYTSQTYNAFMQIKQQCENAIQDLHKHYVVHRDVKLVNFLYRENPLQIVVSDVGTATDETKRWNRRRRYEQTEDPQNETCPDAQIGTESNFGYARSLSKPDKTYGCHDPDEDYESLANSLHKAFVDSRATLTLEVRKQLYEQAPAPLTASATPLDRIIYECKMLGYRARHHQMGTQLFPTMTAHELAIIDAETSDEEPSESQFEPSESQFEPSEDDLSYESDPESDDNESSSGYDWKYKDLLDDPNAPDTAHLPANLYQNNVCQGALILSPPTGKGQLQRKWGDEISCVSYDDLSSALRHPLFPCETDVDDEVNYDDGAAMVEITISFNATQHTLFHIPIKDIEWVLSRRGMSEAQLYQLRPVQLAGSSVLVPSLKSVDTPACDVPSTSRPVYRLRRVVRTFVE